MATPLPTLDHADAMTVSEVPAGQCGTVVHIDAGEFDLERLKTMGICLGRRVIVHKAGDPLIVQVMGARLGLARSLAQCIRVTPGDQPVCCMTE